VYFALTTGGIAGHFPAGLLLLLTKGFTTKAAAASAVLQSAKYDVFIVIYSH
jgi:hypothetical protein